MFTADGKHARNLIGTANKAKGWGTAKFSTSEEHSMEIDPDLPVRTS